MDADAKGRVILTVEAAGLSPDLATVDWLARVALLARRQHGRMAVRGACPQLRDLIELIGLDEVLGADTSRSPPPPLPEGNV